AAHRHLAVRARVPRKTDVRRKVISIGIINSRAAIEHFAIRTDGIVERRGARGSIGWRTSRRWKIVEGERAFDSPIRFLRHAVVLIPEPVVQREVGLHTPAI